MSDFVYVTAQGPGRKVEMTIPVARWYDALAALASVMPADMTWTARPVENIDLRKAVEVSGSSSRPREPEAVEGDRAVQPSATGARPGEESHVQPADPARPPSPPQDENLIVLQGEAWQAVTSHIASGRPALEEWLDFKGTAGLRTDPKYWTVRQCESVISWFGDRALVGEAS